MMYASTALSQKSKATMGIRPGQPDPMPERRALLEYIGEHGPMRAAEMAGAGSGHTPRLVWLQKEGYVDCDRSGSKGAMWDITPMGRRWILKIDGTPVKPRTIAYGGNAMDAPDRIWPNPRVGSMVAYSLQSKGSI